MASFAAVGGPRTAWLTSLGLLGAGWVTAHVLSYLIFVPDTAERERMLMATGHGYFRTSDLLFLCLTLTLAGLAMCVLAGPNQHFRAPSPWILALLPPLGFVIQEHGERLFAERAVPTHLLTEPRFLLGLLLQLPFALCALLVARLLLTAARSLALVARRSARPEFVSAEVQWAPSPQPCWPRVSVLALRQGERAPPLATAR